VKTATYLYGVFARAVAPDVDGAPEGLPGLGPVRALPAGPKLWLLAADAPLAHYGAAPIERGLKDLDWVGRRAMAHERMVEHFGAQGTIVPMKMFTLFTSDERALAHVAGERRRLSALVKRLSGRQEWGLRVSLDAQAAREAARQTAATSTRGLRGGTQFLMARKVVHSESRRLAADARREAERLFERLTARASESRRRPATAGDGREPLLLDAAFLVTTARGAAFQALVGREADALRSRGCRVVLTGPWPPYNFLEAGR
jgi:hypothetical protein